MTAADLPFTIDSPTLADAPALARIHVRGWEIAYGHLLAGEQWFGQPAIERRTAQWISWLTPGSPASDQGVLRLGRDAGGTPIGLAGSWPPRDSSPVRDRELSLLYIDRAWFGSGLARSLAEAVIGDEPASVWVAEENPRARRFYEKLGFVADGATQVEEQLGSIRDLRMVR
ncbi:GNAT family N-acetyltransferase [Brachybacterium sp. FME24]|uniref:GNAT family N-acetyltransferase n=1 Tax=Brachybacterium sp. FME24 TaxID=2742605 RepID=UPI001865DD1E|nr:GNAT family N-acetyltransferase [Brachybacterium sp. FME24]